MGKNDALVAWLGGGAACMMMWATSTAMLGKGMAIAGAMVVVLI